MHFDIEMHGVIILYKLNLKEQSEMWMHIFSAQMELIIGVLFCDLIFIGPQDTVSLL